MTASAGLDSGTDLLLFKGQTAATEFYTVTGTAGAVQLVVIMMPELPPDVPGEPQAGPILVHSRQPRSDLRRGPCSVFGGGWCYASYGSGKKAYRLLWHCGEQALFGHLEDLYRSRFRPIVSESGGTER